MDEIIKKIARGKKGSQDLRYEEAYEAAGLIAEGKSSTAQTAGILIAGRMKGETSEEIAAFTQAFRQRSHVLSIRNGLDCAGAYDGRSHSFFATIPVAAILASCGVPAILHGSATLPPKYGVVLQDVIEVLGGRWQMKPGRDRKCTPHYLSTEAYCPPLVNLRPIREQLGVRTILNHVEKWLNLGSAESIVFGVFHLTALKKASEVLRLLGIPQGLIVQGIDGSEDISTHCVSRAVLVRGEKLEEITIDPAEWDLHQALPKERMNEQEQVAMIQRILHAEKTEFRSMVLLNAAVRLWLMDKVESIKEGIWLADQKLDNGQAGESLLRSISE